MQIGNLKASLVPFLFRCGKVLAEESKEVVEAELLLHLELSRAE